MQINVLIIVAFSIFVIKNITRLQYENDKYQYDLFINPYFNLDEKNFNFQKILSELNYEYRKDHDSYYLILNYKIIKGID